MRLKGAAVAAVWWRELAWPRSTDEGLIVGVAICVKIWLSDEKIHKQNGVY